jgi:DNA polymerase-3 subunit alpha
MDAQRADFVAGCESVNGIGKAKANDLFDLIDKFAGYGFNKSHAAAYALVAYQTAWMKAHHKPEFYAASMCYDMTSTDKLAIFVDDMRRMGVPCLPPCINASSAEFAVEGIGVRYALGALKNVGEKAMEQLCEERLASGPFKTLDEFADRIDPRLLNRRQLESLAAGGAFDGIAPAREAVFAGAETILAHAASVHESRTSGQGGLFGGDGATGVAPIRLPQTPNWSLAERMAAEKEAFGFYFSAHPLDRYRHLVGAQGARSFAELSSMPASVDGGRSGAVMGALVEDVRWRTSARGRRYLLATCSDASGQYIASCFDDPVSAELEEAAKSGACLLMTVELDRRPGEETPRVTVRRVQPFESLSTSSRLLIEVETDDPAVLGLLAALVEGERGGRGELILDARWPNSGSARVRLGRDLLLDAELAARIERLPGITAVRLRMAEGPRLALVS